MATIAVHNYNYVIIIASYIIDIEFPVTHTGFHGHLVVSSSNAGNRLYSKFHIGDEANTLKDQY